MKKIVLTVLLCLLLGWLGIASTPSPPSLAPVPAPSGWTKVFDSGFNDVRQICVSDLTYFEGSYFLGFQNSIDSLQSSASSAGLLTSANASDWQTVDLTQSSQQVINHRFVIMDGSLYDLPGYWRGKQVMLKLTPGNAAALAATFVDDQHFAFSQKIAGQWVLGFNTPAGVEIWRGKTPETLQQIDLPLQLSEAAAFTSGQTGMLQFEGNYLVGLSGVKGGALLATQDGSDWQLLTTAMDGISAASPLTVHNGQLFVLNQNEEHNTGQSLALVVASSDLLRWQPISGLTNPDHGSDQSQVDLLAHDQWLYAVLNYLPEHSYTQQHLINPPIAELLRSTDGQDWEAVPDIGSRLTNAHHLRLYLFSDGLYLTSSDYDGYDRVWYSVDGNTWTQIYGTSNTSASLMDSRLFQAGDQLFHVVCDRNAGASLTSYPLQFGPAQTRESAAPSAQSDSGSQAQNSGKNPTYTAVLWVIFRVFLIIFLFLAIRKFSRKGNLN